MGAQSAGNGSTRVGGSMHLRLCGAMIGRAHTSRCFCPYPLPLLELGGSYLIPSEISFVKAQQLVLCHFPETLTIGRVDFLLCPSGNHLYAQYTSYTRNYNSRIHENVAHRI